MKTNVIVTKNDIYKLGSTAYSNDDNCLSIICKPDVARIEEMLLRSILKCWGDYQIINVDDFIWDTEPIQVDVEISTNLPYSLYINNFKNRNN